MDGMRLGLTARVAITAGLRNNNNYNSSNDFRIDKPENLE